jgi:hypothetical protein
MVRKDCLAVAIVVLAGCDVQSTPRPIETPDPGTTESAIVGAEGGSVTLAGVTLDIPAAAVADDTEISVTMIDRPVPAAFTASSPVYRFEPAGQVFAEPVVVTLPVSGSSEHATIFWTVQEGDAFTALPTTVAGGRASAEIVHFSEGFVGSGCEGQDCCDAPNSVLDVVLLVDNSNSMSEEQALLAEQLPRMARVFATGDLDGDGEQDFPALSSVRIGVVTSDMGTAGYSIMTCDDALFGDDGMLRDLGNPEIAGCEASYPAFAELTSDAGPGAIEGFVRHVECVGRAGTGGCGFEQQLEAALKAVTPSSSDIRFFDGSPGQGDRANAGFLRDDSMVAFVVLTDEDDCSTQDGELYNVTRDDLGPLNVRCVLHPDELQPVERYAEGLRAIREDPADVILGVVAGVPEDLSVTTGDPAAFDAILSDERMTTTIDPANPNDLVPSCDTALGRAYPPRRLVEVASSFGRNGVVQSICQGDFTPVVNAVLERVATRALGGCM